MNNSVIKLLSKSAGLEKLCGCLSLCGIKELEDFLLIDNDAISHMEAFIRLRTSKMTIEERRAVIDEDYLNYPEDFMFTPVVRLRLLNMVKKVREIMNLTSIKLAEDDVVNIVTKSQTKPQNLCNMNVFKSIASIIDEVKENRCDNNLYKICSTLNKNETRFSNEEFNSSLQFKNIKPSIGNQIPSNTVSEIKYPESVENLAELHESIPGNKNIDEIHDSISGNGNIDELHNISGKESIHKIDDSISQNENMGELLDAGNKNIDNSNESASGTENMETNEPCSPTTDVPNPLLEAENIISSQIISSLEISETKKPSPQKNSNSHNIDQAKSNEIEIPVMETSLILESKIEACDSITFEESNNLNNQNRVYKVRSIRPKFVPNKLKDSSLNKFIATAFANQAKSNGDNNANNEIMATEVCEVEVNPKVITDEEIKTAKPVNTLSKRKYIKKNNILSVEKKKTVKQAKSISKIESLKKKKEKALEKRKPIKSTTDLSKFEHLKNKENIPITNEKIINNKPVRTSKKLDINYYDFDSLEQKSLKNTPKQEMEVKELDVTRKLKFNSKPLNHSTPYERTTNQNITILQKVNRLSDNSPISSIVRNHSFTDIDYIDIFHDKIAKDAKRWFINCNLKPKIDYNISLEKQADSNGRLFGYYSCLRCKETCGTAKSYKFFLTTNKKPDFCNLKMHLKYHFTLRLKPLSKSDVLG